MTRVVLMKIAPFPAGKVLSVLYLVVGVFLIPFFFLGALMSPEETPGSRTVMMVFSVFLPLIYAFVGFLTGVIGGGLYNFVTGFLGGVPMTFAAVEPAEAPRTPAESVPR